MAGGDVAIGGGGAHDDRRRRVWRCRGQCHRLQQTWLHGPGRTNRFPHVVHGRARASLCRGPRGTGLQLDGGGRRLCVGAVGGAGDHAVYPRSLRRPVASLCAAVCIAVVVSTVTIPPTSARDRLVQPSGSDDTWFRRRRPQRQRCVSGPARTQIRPRLRVQTLIRMPLQRRIRGVNAAGAQGRSTYWTATERRRDRPLRVAARWRVQCRGHIIGEPVSRGVRKS